MEKGSVVNWLGLEWIVWASATDPMDVKVLCVVQQNGPENFVLDRMPLDQATLVSAPTEKSLQTLEAWEQRKQKIVAGLAQYRKR